MKNYFYPLAALIFVATPVLANDDPPPKHSPERIQHDIEDNQKLADCVKLASTSPDKAYDEALNWRIHNGGLLAEECLAMVNIAREEYSYGAKKLYMIANATDAGDKTKRLSLLVKSGNTFLIAEDPENAKRAFDDALAIKGDDANIYVDRARTYAMLEKWDASETDLTQAMKLGGELPFALRLRAETRLQQKNYSGAETDINRAIELEPKEVDNYVVRGRVREAKRLGHAP
ncbi:tetratricopeptide repeat protein [Pseudaquidulcibacter saccharophilus]|uniref:tetratricopeptide repeat protein n=1 Tax=Pseudaquidulcibacter saccharophilus TaxID=2831900 RepID=UPI001EFF0D2F|nr:hypothetical protein [Pseudaquidulcibacter saccharophilus]